MPSKNIRKIGGAFDDFLDTIKLEKITDINIKKF